MMFQGKSLNAVRKEDLFDLLQFKVQESETLDYKDRFPETKGDIAARKLCADVVAFANTRGGFLVIGIDDRDRIPVEIPGVEEETAYNELTRLKDCARKLVQPRPPEFVEAVIPIGDGKAVGILGILPSHTAPHCFLSGEFPHFYYRAAGNNVPMNLDNLRDAFFGSQANEQRLQDEIERTLYYAPALTGDRGTLNTTVILQLVPVGRMRFGGIDLHAAANSMSEKSFLTDPHARGVCWRFNGPRQQQVNEHQSLMAHIDLYRSGSVAAHSARIINSHPTYGPFMKLDTPSRICILATKVFDLSSVAGTNGPFVISLAIKNSLGMKLGPTYAETYPGTVAVTESELICESIFVPDLSIPPADLLRPAFDRIWNAFGLDRCGAYDDNGRLFKG